jgi:hypothetical protein
LKVCFNESLILKSITVSGENDNTSNRGFSDL